MKRNFWPLKLLIFMILLVSFNACKKESPKGTLIEINKKMTLLEWPDSSYVSNLDSILAKEPIKKEKKSKANIAMNAHEAPIFKLPNFITGKKDTPKNENQNKSTIKNKNEIFNKQTNSNNDFVDKFSNALSKLQSDPSNADLYKIIEAKQGEDLFKLLKRTYGASSQNLPRFYVLSTLQSVNAGVALEHLQAGDKVRVPKL